MATTRRPRQARAKQTVQSLVDAGFLLIQRQGKEAFTTRNVAQLAGVGVGSVYEYFADKQALLDAMQAQAINALLRMLRSNMANRVQLNPRELILNLLADLRTFLHADGGRYAAYVATLSPRDLEVIFPRLSQALGDLAVQYALHHPELLKVKRLPIISYIIIHGGTAVIRQHLSEDQPLIPFDELAEGLATMVDALMQPETQTQAITETANIQPGDVGKPDSQ